jgi:hypothetical protein
MSMLFLLLGFKLQQVWRPWSMFHVDVIEWISCNSWKRLSICCGLQTSYCVGMGCSCALWNSSRMNEERLIRALLYKLKLELRNLSTFWRQFARYFSELLTKILAYPPSVFNTYIHVCLCLIFPLMSNCNFEKMILKTLTAVGLNFN